MGTTDGHIVMSTANHSSNNNLQQPESLEERVGILLDELALAVQWNRPSILLAVYRSEFVCAQAQVMLEKKLIGIKQGVSRLTVNVEHTDVPMFLSKYSGRDKTVFF